MELNSSKLASSTSKMRKLALALMLIVSINGFAYALPNPPAEGDKLVAVTSMGVTDGQMLFNIKYDNVNQDKLYIVLHDETGNVLYKDVISDKVVNKTFKTTADVGTLVLIVTNSNNKKVQKFEISNEKRYVEELVITSVHK